MEFAVAEKVAGTEVPSIPNNLWAITFSSDGKSLMIPMLANTRS